MVKNKATIAGIDFRVTATGNGKGFVSAISEDRGDLEIAALVAISKIKGIKKTKIEYEAPWTFTRSNGEVREMGNYYRFVAKF